MGCFASPRLMPTAHASPLYAQWRSGAIGSSRSERCMPTIEQGVRLCRCYRSTVSKRALQSSCSSSGRTWSTNSAHADADAKRTGAAALRCTRWACLDHVVLRCTVPQPCAARAGLTTHRTASCAPQRVAGTCKPESGGGVGGCGGLGGSTDGSVLAYACAKFSASVAKLP